MNIPTIIELSGGKAELRAFLSQSGPKSPTLDAIRKWTVNGVPHWYWDAIVKASKGRVRIEDIHAANNALKSTEPAK